jgi:hypothetical protein
LWRRRFANPYLLSSISYPKERLNACALCQSLQLPWDREPSRPAGNLCRKLVAAIPRKADGVFINVGDIGDWKQRGSSGARDNRDEAS